MGPFRALPRAAGGADDLLSKSPPERVIAFPSTPREFRFLVTRRGGSVLATGQGAALPLNEREGGPHGVHTEVPSSSDRNRVHPHHRAGLAIPGRSHRPGSDGPRGPGSGHPGRVVALPHPVAATAA